MDERLKAKLAQLAERCKAHKAIEKAARESRNAAIIEAYEAGASIREIKAATGVSHGQIHRVILGEYRRRLAGGDTVQAPSDSAGRSPGGRSSQAPTSERR